MKEIIKRKETHQRGGDVMSLFIGGDIYQASSIYLIIVALTAEPSCAVTYSFLLYSPDSRILYAATLYRESQIKSIYLEYLGENNL